VSSLNIDFFKKNEDKFFFIPLGGCNEIGMNFNLYYTKGKFLLIDCGIGFTSGTVAGVDIMLPSSDFLNKYSDMIAGMVITHIHEDHIGAVPYLWQKLDCKIYATKLCANFLKEKLSDKEFRQDVPVQIIKSSQKFNIGPFELEPVGITHSVPEMQGLFISTPYGKIFHTGDWKLDKKPVVGLESDLKRIKELSKEGVHSMMCDSTNVFNPGHSGFEGDLEKEIVKAINEYKHSCVFLTTFASNIARMQTIVNVAKKTKRKIVIAGRSIDRIIGVARDSGYLLDDVFLDSRDFTSLKREQAIVLCTGCQGEELAAMTKIAENQNRNIQIRKGDVVMFSSKIIPGNEKKILALYNKLALLDVEIVTEKTHDIHVSGHPNRDELKRMYEVVKPMVAVPVHGEPAHLREHCKFARELGINKTYRAKNGDVVEIYKEGVRKAGTVSSGYKLVDGNIIRDIGSKVIKEREILSNAGIVLCKVIPLKGQELDVELLCYGFLDSVEDKSLMLILKQYATDAVRAKMSTVAKSTPKDELFDAIQRSIVKFCEKRFQKSPLVKLVE